MAVNLQFKTTRAGYYETHVRSILQLLCRQEDPRSMFFINVTPSSVWSRFDGEVQKIKRRNTMTADQCYKAELSTDGRELTIYHIDMDGKMDRTVAIVSETINPTAG